MQRKTSNAKHRNERGPDYSEVRKMNKLFHVCVALTLTACSQQQASNDASQTSKKISNTTTPAVNVPAGTYTLDKAHASLVFRVNHLGFSHYTAQFKTFDAQVQFDPKNLAASTVSATIDPRSLDLDNPPPGFVDALLGEQWLDAKQFPQMSFKSTRVDSLSIDTVRIVGDFTLHGVTKPVTLEAQFNGGYAGHPMDPHARIGFSAHAMLKRSEFGIVYGIPEPGSTMGVSDAVEFIIEAEFSGPPLVSSKLDVGEHK